MLNVLSIVCDHSLNFLDLNYNQFAQKLYWALLKVVINEAKLCNEFWSWNWKPQNSAENRYQETSIEDGLQRFPLNTDTRLVPNPTTVDLNNWNNDCEIKNFPIALLSGK